MNIYQKLLVAIDLSDHSDETLRKATSLAEKLGATLYLMHVVEPIPVAAYPFMESSSIDQQMLDAATNQVHDKGRLFEIPHGQVFVEIGLPKNAILVKASQLRADLIIIGSHSHSTLAKILGTTAAAIVNAATQDVLVISPLK